MPDYPQFKSGSEIRQTFLDFYAQREHKVLPSASLVPEDPTVLLTIAGCCPSNPFS
jgi:alanyl-tRNA synthetase